MMNVTKTVTVRKSFENNLTHPPQMGNRDQESQTWDLKCIVLPNTTPKTDLEKIVNQNLHNTDLLPFK
jgi:hypothetical protein